MKEVSIAKELLDKNRLLVVLTVAWVIVSNLLYFSEVGKLSCIYAPNYEGAPSPDRIIFWNKLSLGYVSLYESILEPLQFPLKASICSQVGFSFSGYFSFVLFPLLTIMLLTIAIKWVRRA